MLTKEEIILLFLEDPYKLADEIGDGNVPKSDEIRTLICELGNTRCAYSYARYVDEKPTDETRQVARKDSGFAYFYARWVDRSPRSDTRQAARKDPYWKERYISWVEECSLKKI